MKWTGARHLDHIKVSIVTHTLLIKIAIPYPGIDLEGNQGNTSQYSLKLLIMNLIKLQKFILNIFLVNGKISSESVEKYFVDNLFQKV